MPLLARSQCRCRDHQGRPGPRAHLDRQGHKARLGCKAPLEWPGPWGPKENQAKQAPVVQLVPKERSDRPVAEGRVVLPGLVEKRVLRAPWARPVRKGNKVPLVKKVT